VEAGLRRASPEHTTPPCARRSTQARAADDGKVTNDVGFVGRRILLIGMIMGAALALIAVLSIAVFKWWWAPVLGLPIVLALDKLSDPGKRLDPLRWINGLEGEYQVSRTLRDLENHGFHVIDHVDVGYGDVDHVLVGPTGIFAVETKNWPGRVEVNPDGVLLRTGRFPQEGVLNQAVRGAISIRELADVRWVEAVLVCVNAEVLGEPIALPAVTVLSPGRLNGFVTTQRERLRPEEVGAVVARLEGGAATRSASGAREAV
jgi:hypothetical protein